MKTFLATLTCDHELLIAAESLADAQVVAASEALTHRVMVVGVSEVVSTGPQLLCIYPGPMSADAVGS